MLSRPGGRRRSGIRADERPWVCARGLAREAGDRASPRCPLARGQGMAGHTLPSQGARAGEVAVLAALGLFRCEGKYPAQVQSRCFVSGENLPPMGF